MTTWYEAKPKPYDLPGDGEPIAYFLNKNHAQEYSNKLWLHLADEIKEIKNPSHLEYILKNNEKEIASFKFEIHATKYNHEKFNGKATIEPNPK
jgi:hypothetical protein